MLPCWINEYLKGSTTLGRGLTFAADAIGGDYVFRFLNGAAGTLTRDIIAEAPTLSASASGPLTVNYTMSNEIGTLPHAGYATVVAADPLFVFVSPDYYGDFHPTSGSPALDFAPAVAGDVDIELTNRSVDLPDLPNIFGSTDLGAYERQYCAPPIRSSATASTVDTSPEGIPTRG